MCFKSFTIASNFTTAVLRLHIFLRENGLYLMYVQDHFVRFESVADRPLLFQAPLCTYMYNYRWVNSGRPYPPFGGRAGAARAPAWGGWKVSGRTGRGDVRVGVGG